MWLAEANGLRILCDPLLDDLHHGGIFEVFPGRSIDAAALRPDFLLVSHRHPDHFDPKSLRRLAELDPDTVVVTSDPLVGEICRKVGFSTTKLIAPETKIDLDGPTLLTTPSANATDPEWGVIVATDDGVVWNQIDTSLGSIADVGAFFVRAAQALGRPRKQLVTLALARWQPLLEVEHALGERIGFPFAAYASELEHVAAIDARVVCPSSAGAVHAAPFGALNRLVYPISEERFVQDAKKRMPGVRVVSAPIGATFRIRNGEVSIDERGAIEAGLVSVNPSARDPRDFRPLEIPALVDPNIDGREEREVRERIDRWARGDLARALGKQAPLVRVLEVVLPTETVTYTFDGGAVDVGSRSDWDVRCAVAGTLLDDVLAARRHWGDLLLAGMLRGVSRAYTVDPTGLRRNSEQPLFVYHAISYEESVRRELMQVMIEI